MSRGRKGSTCKTLRPLPTFVKVESQGSTEAQELPRLRDYASGTDRLALWQRDVRKSAGGFSKGKRAHGTSAGEHSLLYSGKLDFAVYQ